MANDKSNDNTVEGLRSILFETMRKLSENKIPVEEAKCIAQTASVVVESVKTEVSYYKMMEGDDKKPITFFPKQGNLIEHDE